MIIDVHAHCTPRSYSELVGRVTGRTRMDAPYPVQDGGSPPPQSDDPAAIQARLEIMDEAGVQMQVLSQPGGPYFDDEGEAVEGAQLLNDAYARIVEAHPGRFAAYGVLPLPHVEASIRELGRVMDDLGFVGVVIACSIQRTRSPLEEQFEPLYAELNRRGCAVFFHPSGNGLCSDLINDYGLTYAAGAPLEDTTIVAQLIARKIPSRYPDIKFVIAHFGGAIPMMLQRLDHEAPSRLPPLDEPPSATARRLYYDTVGHGSPVALSAAYQAFGANHLMAGSDYPITVFFEPYAANFQYLSAAGLSPFEVDQITSGNAMQLLGLLKG
jgi:6-methylsalicylate decarboxylase